jgi:hypothetical protein
MGGSGHGPTISLPNFSMCGAQCLNLADQPAQLAQDRCNASPDSLELQLRPNGRERLAAELKLPTPSPSADEVVA